MSTVGFFALAVFSLGVLSVVTDADIISVSGQGTAPGAIGMATAVAVFAGLLWAAVRVAHPRFPAVGTIALTTALMHLLAVGGVALIASGDPVTTLAVVGGLITGGASAVILFVAAVAAWCGVALRRTRARRPQWPWEREDPDGD